MQIQNDTDRFSPREHLRAVIQQPSAELQAKTQ